MRLWLYYVVAGLRRITDWFKDNVSQFLKVCISVIIFTIYDTYYVFYHFIIFHLFIYIIYHYFIIIVLSFHHLFICDIYFIIIIYDSLW